MDSDNIKIKLLEEKFGEDDFLYSLVLPFIMNIKMNNEKLDNSDFSEMIRNYVPKAMELNRELLIYLLEKNNKESDEESILENKEVIKILNESSSNNWLLYTSILVIVVIIILLLLRAR